jgi:hypothetical protein
MFRYIKQEGSIDTATWLIIFREDFETIQSALSVTPGEGPNARRYFNALLTARHETIHFWDAINTNFLYSYSVNYLQRCMEVLNTIQDAGKSYYDIPFSEFKNAFTELTEILTSEIYPIRTLDVIEGRAVLCSYRMHVPQASHIRFLDHLQENHFGQKQYTDAYFYATELIGEKAFDLFSLACYLALQGDNPGRNFEDILLWARDKLSFFNAKENPLSFLLDATNMSMNGCFPSIVKKKGVPQGFFNHPILQPYIEEIIQRSDIQVEDFFARPYYYEPYNSPGHHKEMEKFILRIVPPMHLYSGRMAKLMGLGGELGKNYGILIHHLTALIGLIPLLVFGIKDEMICPHLACPVYKKGLCQKYYAFPIDDYKNCKFPEILEGTKLGRLLED